MSHQAVPSYTHTKLTVHSDCVLKTTKSYRYLRHNLKYNFLSSQTAHADQWILYRHSVTPYSGYIIHSLVFDKQKAMARTGDRTRDLGVVSTTLWPAEHTGHACQICDVIYRKLKVKGVWLTSRLDSTLPVSLLTLFRFKIAHSNFKRRNRTIIITITSTITKLLVGKLVKNGTNVLGELRKLIIRTNYQHIPQKSRGFSCS